MAISNTGTAASNRVSSTAAAWQPTSGLTMCAWAKFDSGGTNGPYRTICSLWDESGWAYGYTLGMSKDAGGANTNKIHLVDFTKGFGTVGSGHNDDVWTFAVGRMNSATWKCHASYRRITDASLTHGTELGAHSSPSGLDVLHIAGVSWASNENLCGTADNLIIYDGYLTDAELEQQSRRRLPVRPDLVKYWFPLLNRSTLTQTIADSGPLNAAAFTQYGTVSLVDGAPIPWGAPSRIFSPSYGEATQVFTSGDAIAAGQAASFARSLGLSPGAATAAGLEAAFARSAGMSTGDAVAAGLVAVLTRSLGASSGQAIASGSLASFARSLSLSLGEAHAEGNIVLLSAAASRTYSIGAAEGAGSTASLSAAATLSASVGAAQAAGSSASFSRVLSGSIGGATAQGASAGLQAQLSGATGAAQADGAQASLAAALSSSPGAGEGSGASYGPQRTFGAGPGAAVAAGSSASFSAVLGLDAPGQAEGSGEGVTLGRTVSYSPGQAEASGQAPVLMQTLSMEVGAGLALGLLYAGNGTQALSCSPGEAVGGGSSVTLQRTQAFSTGDALAQAEQASLIAELLCASGSATGGGNFTPEIVANDNGSGYWFPVRARRNRRR